MNGIVAALRDAVFFAPTSIGSGQHGNPLRDFKAFDAANFNTSAATGTLRCVHYRYPFFSHDAGVLLAIAGYYFTMIVPFIHGCGAHWKCTTPF
jgi:hypothetical protein